MVLIGLFFVFFIDIKAQNDMKSLASDMKKDYYISKIRGENLSIEQRYTYLDSLLRLNVLHPGEFLDYRVNMYISSGRYQDAIKLLSDARASGKFSVDTTLYVLYTLSYCHLVLGKYENSLDCLYELMTTDKADELRSYDVQGDYLIAYIYRMCGDYKRSDSVLMRAKELITEYKMPSDQLHTWYLEYADACINQGKYKEALKNIQDATALKGVDKESSLNALKSLAELYHKIGEKEIADEYYKKYINQIDQSADRIYAINNYCMLLKDMGHLEDAERLCREQIEYVEQNGMNSVKADLYETLSEILYEAKDFYGAYNAHLKFYEVKDSVLWMAGPSLTNDFNNRIAKFERDKIGNAQSRHNMMWLVLTVIILFAATGVVCMIYYRSKRNKEFFSPKQLPDIIKDTPDQATEEQVENLNREMLGLSLKIAENERTLNDVWEIVLDPTKTEADKKKELIVMQKSRDVKRDIWESFTLYFQKVHPQFTRELYRVHPDLSRGEVRMCAFIIMHYSTKDIAMVTNRSVRTIQSMKYRLHKKLNPPEGVSTEAYLRSLIPEVTR